VAAAVLRAHPGYPMAVLLPAHPGGQAEHHRSDPALRAPSPSPRPGGTHSVPDLGGGVHRVAGVVYTLTAGVLAQLDELDASKLAHNQADALPRST
jgi:hypothetical protein